MGASLQQLAMIGLTFVAVMPAQAQSEDVAEPAFHSSHIGANVGGTYSTNVYGNASQTPDIFGVANLSLDSDLMPSSDVIIKLNYHGALELYGDLTGEKNYGHDGAATLGFRPADNVYASLRTGAEHAFFPDRPEYNFWGLVGRAGVRWEAGEASTLEFHYQLRSDQFPQYDLDNLAHAVGLEWSTAMGDHIELELPVNYRANFYRERFLLDEAGEKTATQATSQRIGATPTVVILPSYNVEIATAILGEYNDSNDTYVYEGPVDVADPTVDQELIAHFFSYWGAGLDVTVEWNPIETLLLKVGITGGARGFTHRPAYDEVKVAVGENQRDLYLAAGTALEWRLFDLVVLGANYRFLRQWSNDTLDWDFSTHRVNLFVGTWWEN